MHLGMALRSHLEENGLVPAEPRIINTEPMGNEDLPWYLREKQDRRFKEMLREKALANAQVL